MLSSPGNDTQNAARYRIVLADDQELIREGIAAVVTREAGCTICGCAADAATAFDLVARHRPDLLLIDVFLVGHNGLHLLEDLVARHPGTRILALSAFEEQTTADRFVRAGASGLLIKSASSAQLIEAIRTVASGKIYLGPRMRGPEPSRAIFHVERNDE